MRLLNLLSTVVVLLILHVTVIAQDTTGVAKDTTNLMNQLEKESGGYKTHYATNTFSYTRIINGHSVENLPAHVMDLRISHRFGPLSGGFYKFFGLDYAPFNVRIAFDFGITKNFMMGVGHNGWQKTYDAFFKWKILTQSKGTVNMPVSVSLVPTVATNTVKSGDFGYELFDTLGKTDRLSYVIQVLIARKFSEGFSLQLMPTYVHADNVSFNHLKGNIYKRDIFAIGIGGRQKISKKMSINAEYYYQMPGSQPPGSANSLSVGLDIGTGGHDFQLLFTNAIGLTEKSFIAETDEKGITSGLRFGFNISRVFQLGKKHKGTAKDWKK